MNLLDLLAEFLRIFVDLIPRFEQRAWSTHWMVVDSFLIGPHIACRRPVLVWPIMDGVQYWPNTEQTVDLDAQTVTTSDEVTLTVNTQLTYLITDPLAARAAWGDEEAVAERIGAVVRNAVEYVHSGANWEDIRIGMDHDWVIDEVRDYLSDRGVKIPEMGFCIEERAKTRTLRIFGVNS